MTRRVVVLGLALQAAGLATADEVFIRGGGHLSGKVVERGPDSILVDIGTGQIGLLLSSVERIVPGETPVELDQQRTAELAADHLARGYVRFEGAWVTPDERRARIEDRRAAAEERRERAEADARIREAEARARVAEAEAQRAELDLLRMGGEARQEAPGFAVDNGWTPWFTGSFYSPVLYSAYAYPAFPYLGTRRSHVRPFASRPHSCRSGCGHRPPSSVGSPWGRVPGRAIRHVAQPVRPAPTPVRHVPRRSSR